MRRLLFLSCVAAICLGFYGCGSEVSYEAQETVVTQEAAATHAPTPSPTPSPTPTPEPEPEPIELPEDGSLIELAGIQWRVLDSYENYVLIVSEYVLFQRPFHGNLTRVTWEQSDIRAYLNDEFLEIFSDEELNMIALNYVVTNDNPWFAVPGGYSTYDKVFLLSLEEAVKYFGDSGRLDDQHHPENETNVVDDEYSEARITVDVETGLERWWWFRSPGVSQRAAIVSVCGRLGIGGVDVTNAQGGLRPAMWIDFYLFYEYASSYR